MKTKIAISKSDSRYQNILDSLNLIQQEILEKLKNKKNIVIKPNCVSDEIQLASTHKDSIKAVLDFLKQNNIDSKITIAEGSAYSTEKAFENFRYYELKDYNLEFKDINNDEFEEIQGFDKNQHPIKLGLSKTLLDSDFVISLAIPKTHDSVIATLGIKNIAVGSLIKKTLFKHRIDNSLLRKIVNRATAIRNDKGKIHQGPKAINKNIFEIYKKLKPDLVILDAFQAMEGNGPIDGTPLDLKLAIASTSAIAADLAGLKLMSIKPDDVGYLYYISKYENLNQNDLEVIGNTTLEKEKRKFRLHDNIQSQKNWR